MEGVQVDRAEKLIREAVDVRGSFDVEERLRRVEAIGEIAARGGLAPHTVDDVRTIVRRKIWRTI
jgi:hypothetical protein